MTRAGFLRRCLTILACVTATAVIGVSSASASSQVYPNVSVAGTMPSFTITQGPTVQWTFTTSAISTGGDTVIHVQNNDDPNGGFIAGNDDFINGSYASQVVVPPTGTSRTLRVIVRAYSNASAGSCTLTLTPSTGTPTVYPALSFGGTVQVTDAMPARTHVVTAEAPGGATDTVMLVIGDRAEHAIGYDDDDGVGYMSWIHLPEACTACSIVIGNFSINDPPLPVTLIRDDDVDTSDSDGDGLGTALETVLGTNPNQADSDRDGLNDNLELFGYESVQSPSHPVKLPRWGANPTQQDLFAEVDWTCPDPSCTAKADLGQLSGAIVANIRQDFLPIRVHFDIGVPNPDPNTATDWGDWGGANRQSGPASSGCDYASPERLGLFHFGVSQGGGAGGTSNYGPCFLTVADSSNISHELGHGFGLEHGGRPTTLGFNDKPNYFSRMNYSFQSTAHGFSHGTLLNLNPTALDEQRGVGSTEPALMNVVAQYFKVDMSSGAIDWNRDGLFSPAGVLVAACPMFDDFSYYKGTRFTSTGPTDPNRSINDAVMTWVSVGGAVGDQLWLFGRGGGKQLQYVKQSASALNAGCRLFTSLDDKEVSDCAGFGSTATNYPGNKQLAFGPGAAEAAGGAILVVSQPVTGPLVSNLITISPTTGMLTFGADTTLPGSVTASSDVTALRTGPGTLSAWAISGGRLKQWTYQNGWTAQGDQQWTDGTFITALYGVGAAVGFQDGSSTSSVYAAIPKAPDGTIEFARRESNGRWTKLDTWSQAMSGVHPVVQGRPGLAYQRSAASQSIGRFYMALPAVPGTDDVVHLMITEGNKTTGASQRLAWLPRTTILGAALRGSGASLMDDLTRDTNLRAVLTYGTGETLFMPVADGIANGNITDLDDYRYLTNLLKASLLSQQPYPEPYLVNLRRNDYDGDLKTDLVVFRPTDATWYVRPSRGGSDILTPLGASSDLPTPGDYDGDGKFDVAYFRPSTGGWHARPTTGRNDIVMTWGTSGDIPVPGDYDGDGKTDFAVFRPSNATWYIRPNSGGGDIIVNYGLSTDLPVPGDYDGDGKTDMAIFRPGNGGWFIRPSRGGNDIVMVWGISSDRPVAADYDGDGLADFAVYRPGEGNWYVRPRSGSSDILFSYGLSTDTPVPGDYDGDRKTDFAFYRPADGTWHIHPSAGGSDIITPFGVSTDVVPFAR